MQAGQQESSIGGFLQEQGGMIKELVLNSRELLTQLVIYGLGSIALGFFIKRYFQFVLVSIVVVVITYLLLLLHRADKTSTGMKLEQLFVLSSRICAEKQIFFV